MPDKLGILFKPKRYKVIYGGRGSGKSWGAARALLIRALEGKKRILCTREVQRSIKDSVHKLLSDQIESLGLGQMFQVLDSEIRCVNGSEFLFAGLSTQTVESIKSYEGVDICWCEESQSISNKSWKILTPTIRKPGSEIWITFNPDLDSDPTYTRFVVAPPPNSVVVKMNWRDNPWFPPDLEDERVHCKHAFPDDYENVWEGACKSSIDGAIYSVEIANLIQSGRFRDVPYDPALKVHVVMDLGWNDQTAIGLVQKAATSLNIIEYIEHDHLRLDQYSAMLKERKYNWGDLWMPHDAEHGNIVTGDVSAKRTMEDLGWSVQITPNINVEAGIREARMVFPRLYIDRTNAGILVERLKRYRRIIHGTTEEAGRPMHDKNSHGADMLRYLAINAEAMTNEVWGGKLTYKKLGVA
jgi:phage terminase large subunit